MLDQTKTGAFISETRKEKNLTQKQLADIIGVSDKAISRWETGRGMPDTAIMQELCSVLGINVNELLSGERLSAEVYNGKAEEHMVELIKNKEEGKKEARGNIIGLAVGVVFLLLFVLALSMISGGTGTIIYFLDWPSVFAVVGIQFIILGAGGLVRSFFKSFAIIFKPSAYSGEELSRFAKESEYAVCYGIKALLMAGILSTFIGFIMGLHMMSTPEAIGPTIAVACLTLFYAALFSLILMPIKARLHKLG